MVAMWLACRVESPVRQVRINRVVHAGTAALEGFDDHRNGENYEAGIRTGWHGSVRSVLDCG